MHIIGFATLWSKIPLPLDVVIAEAAAVVAADRFDAGDPSNLGDVLTAGICRHPVAEFATRDEQYERVDGLVVVRCGLERDKQSAMPSFDVELRRARSSRGEI